MQVEINYVRLTHCIIKFIDNVTAAGDISSTDILITNKDGAGSKIFKDAAFAENTH